MKIGVPKEIKPQENRIGLTPESVKTLVGEGHEVLVENNGGFEAGFDNDQYTKAGAKIVKTGQNSGAQNLKKPFFWPTRNIVLIILQPRSQCRNPGFLLKIKQYEH